MSVIQYLEYHEQSYAAKDIDPAYPMLKYICDRFELNIEQCCWIAFLYGCTYCGPTVFYIYNEFPDFENVDVARLQRWWLANKNRLLFQTDRLRIRSNNQFVPAFESYRDAFKKGQYKIFASLCDSSDKKRNYDILYRCLVQTKYFGRYSMFLWLECLQRLTDLPIIPTRIDWQNANNCLNGLLLGNNRPEVDKVDNYGCIFADTLLQQTIQKLQQRHPENHTDIWNVETTLCAYYKYHHGKRYIGYYVDRQLEEINKMAAAVPSGVCWDVLYDFRREYFV